MKRCAMCGADMVILLTSYVCPNDHDVEDDEESAYDDITPPRQLAFYGWDDLGNT